MGIQNRPNLFGVRGWGHFEVTGEFNMSTDCKPFSVELSAYFDDELEGGELESMQGHLKECEDCRKGLEKMNKLRSALSTLSQTPIHRRSVLDDLKAKLELDNDEDPSEKSPLPS